MRACGTCPTCVHADTILALRELVYPFVVPLVLVCPRAPWRRLPYALAMRWGYA